MAQRHQHLKTSPASTYEQLGFDQQCDCTQPPTLMSSIVFNYTGHTSNFICWDVSSSWSFQAKALRTPAVLWPIRPFQHIRPLLRRFVYKIVRTLGSIRPYGGILIIDEDLFKWTWNSQSSKANSTTNMIHLIHPDDLTSAISPTTSYQSTSPRFCTFSQQALLVIVTQL